MSSEPQRCPAAPAAIRRSGRRGIGSATGLLLLCLGGCSSGSGDSRVGEHTDVVPTARPQVLNGGTTNVFREGAEVLLLGSASEDGDGPILDWQWEQTDGPAVALIEAGAAGRSFTAPAVAVATALSFRLTVSDSAGQTDSASLSVTVVPARDSNRFLSLDIASGMTFDSFRVVAALDGGAATGPFGSPFSFTAESYLVYPPRGSPAADCQFDSADFASGIPNAVAGGCLVAHLATLTPAAGGAGIEDQWPADVDAPVEDAASMIERWWNPRYTLPVPRLDVREFNQQFVDSGDRARMLDPYAAHDARIVVELQLTAPASQQDASLIVTDLTSTPIAIPQWFQPAGADPDIVGNLNPGQPTRAVVPLETLLAAIEGRESALTAAVYYRTVDPLGTRETLNEWLQQAGFAAAGDGRLRTEAVAGSGQFAHAVYMNNFDLGFGRQMYTRTDEFGNVFSFVQNYRTLASAIRQIDSFVTVVMEYSPLVRHSDGSAKFVKFFTYIDDGSGDEQRVSSFDFDGRGERHTPGNCTTCHGGAKPPGVAELIFDAGCGSRANPACYAWPAVNRNGQDIADGNLQSMFLPWDLDSLLFADTDPAITRAPLPFDGISLAAELRRDYGDYSRGAMETQLKRLNQASFASYADGERTASARRLVEHWYGGADADGRLTGAFDGSAAITGWRNGELVPDPDAAGTLVANPDDAAVIYQDVYAQYCRMCHTNQLDPELRFDTYREFIAQEPRITELVFGSGAMPGARLTMDRFWSPFHGGVAAGTILGEHIGRVLDEPARTAPGSASPVILGLDPPSRRGDAVYLSGEQSVLADSYRWRLDAPAGSRSVLVGGGSSSPLFRPDLPGLYQLSLTLNAGGVNETTTTGALEVGNRMPEAWNDLFVLGIGNSPFAGSVLTGPGRDFDADGDSLAASVAPGGGPAHGRLALGADGRFVYTYTGSTTKVPASDRFDYVVSDGYGGEAAAGVTLRLNAAPAAEWPTPPDLVAVSDDSTAAADASEFRASVRWLASTDDIQVLGYRIYRNGELLAFIPSDAAPGTALSYPDTTVAPDTEYVYRVSAVDADNESLPSAAARLRIATSLRRNLQTGWGSGGDTVWQVSGCVGCHRGAPGGLTLRGPGAAAVYAELTEDAGVARPRVDPGAPGRSLLLCKPLAGTHPRSCEHGGGDFFVSSDPAFQVLLRWIEGGAPDN